MDRLDPSVNSSNIENSTNLSEEGNGFIPKFGAYFSVAFEADSYLYLGKNRNLYSDWSYMILTEAQEELLSELFKYAIASARYDMSGANIGYDGVTLVVTYKGMSAGCWCPEDGLCKELYDLIGNIQEAVCSHSELAFKRLIPDILEMTYNFKKIT